jgi:hypothetical protein
MKDKFISANQSFQQRKNQEYIAACDALEREFSAASVLIEASDKADAKVGGGREGRAPKDHA